MAVDVPTMKHDDQDAEESDVRPTRVRWFVGVLACAASWLLYLHRYAWGVIKPDLKQDYPGLDDVRMGWIDSAFLATYAAGQVPGGVLGDLYGPRIALGLMILVWSLMVAALGWAGGTVGFVLVRAVFGLAQAGAYPVLSQATRRWFPLTVRTSMQGAVAAAGRLGGACASLVVASLLMTGLGLGWRATLVVLAVPGLALAAAVLRIFHDSPRVHPWCNDAECKLVAAGPGRTAAVGRAVFRPSGPALLALGLILFYAFVSTFADQLYVNWIPSVLTEDLKLGKAQMGFFAMLPLLGGTAGSIVGGMANDFLLRRVRPRLARSAVAFTGKGLAAVLIALSTLLADGRAVMVVLFLCKFFNDLSMPTLWGAITDVAGPASGTIFGIVNTVGTLGGFAAGPVMGFLRARHGWEGLFLTVAAVYLAGALTWIFLNCERRLVVESEE
jgi:sugar phosphate permease